MLSIFQDRETPLMGSIVVLGDSVSLSSWIYFPALCIAEIVSSILRSWG